MSLGGKLRTLLGPKLFPAVGRLYRSIFIDLDKVVECLPRLEERCHVLDIGGGDGEIINGLLTKYPNLKITMIDIASRIGMSLRPEFKKNVTVLPNTSIKDYQARDNACPDVVLLSCVIHHIPGPDRPNFFADLKRLIKGRKTMIIVLELEPGYVRSLLGLYSDRYVTGDRHVAFLRKRELIELMNVHFSQMSFEETCLFAKDKPNYCLVFTIQEERKG